MKCLAEVLRRIPEEKVVMLTFSDGEKLLLKNFDPVDESIYDRSDLFCATIVEVIASTKCSSNVGSMIDFSMLETEQVIDLDKNCVLFSSK